MSWQQPPVVSTQRGVSVPAIVIVGLGVVGIALWLFVLDFAGTGDFKFNFADVRTFADLGDLGGLQGAWYSWIAYLSAGLAVLLALLTLVPGSAQPALRAVSVLVAVGSIVLAFLALAGDDGIAVGDRSAGFWVGMIGFLLLAAGSTVRPPTQVAVTTAFAPTPAQQWGGQPSTGQTWSGQQAVPNQTWGQQPVAQQWPPQQPANQAWGQQPAAADPWAATVPAANVGQPAVAAGWHRDPTGRNEQRYWDGQAWTAHVVRGGMQTTDPI